MGGRRAGSAESVYCPLANLPVGGVQGSDSEIATGLRDRDDGLVESLSRIQLRLDFPCESRDVVEIVPPLPTLPEDGQ
jgi:hypothetical protein